METKDNIDRTVVGLSMNEIIGEEISGEIITEMKVMTEAGIGLEKGHFPEVIVDIETEVQALLDPGQDQEPVQTEIE